ncbi:MAG: DUF4390 domain-containing protein [Gemmatimonadales bacterium]
MRRGLAALALLGLATARAGAQAPALTVTANDRAPRVQVADLLTDGAYLELMRSGFPLRLHFRLELWQVRSSWFDRFVRELPWDVVARHDPLADDYVLLRPGGRVTRHASADDLARALGLPYRIALTPPDSGRHRYYYLCRLEVTTLNDTDLAELERWLRGDVGPAVSGEGDVGGALARGAQRVLVRLAGLPRITLEGRSTPFR